MNQEKNYSRREFIQQSTVLGTGMIVAGAGAQRLFAEPNQPPNLLRTVASKGYAARDSSGKLSLWSFERRPVGDNDILLEIKFCGICHSDVHQLRGEWGPQIYPQVPGHEITGVIAAVGRNVSKFKVGDYAGVGTMVGSCESCNSCKRGEESIAITMPHFLRTVILIKLRQQVSLKEGIRTTLSLRNVSQLKSRKR